jgi:hypothetical protein
MRDYKGDFDKIYALAQASNNTEAQKQANLMLSRTGARMVAALQNMRVDVSTVQDLATPMTPEQVATDMAG